MHRLFVALRPPSEMRTQLLSLMGGVPGARWQSDDQLHLTLRFVGEVDAPQADDVAAALGTVDRPRPTIALKGAGSFDHKGHVHSLWAGIAPDDGLKQLHERVDRALVRAGIPPEQRAFSRISRSHGWGGKRGRSSPFLAALPALAGRRQRSTPSSCSKAGWGMKARATRQSPAIRCADLPKAAIRPAALRRARPGRRPIGFHAPKRTEPAQKKRGRPLLADPNSLP